MLSGEIAHKNTIIIKYDFALCTVHLICLFFLIICSHRFISFLNERAMCSLEK